MSKTIIVGAGPTGASLALLLVRQGVDVTLIERESTFDRLFRGEGMVPSGINALIEMGLQKQIEQLPHRRLDRWEFWVNGKRMLNVPEPDRQRDYAVRIMSQPQLLEMLVTEARQYDSFHFMPGCTLRDLLRNGNRCVGVQVEMEGKQQKLHGDMVIGTDGRGSLVRTRAGLELLQPYGQQASNYDFVWFQLPLPPWLEDEMVFYGFAANEQRVTMYPSWNSMLRLGWLVAKGSQRETRALEPEALLEQVASTLPARYAGHIRTYKAEASQPLYLNVLFGYCPQWHTPGVLLLGDAAHPMNPSRAQGINQGLRDAIVAANHLLPVLKDGGTSQELDAAAGSIQLERDPEIKAIQQLQLETMDPPSVFTKGWFRKLVFPVLNQMGIPQRVWLRTEQKLRYGVTPVRLAVSP